jgi:hypothetical protein
LKEGAFPGFAIYSESGKGEGSNRQITGTSYKLIYHAGKRRRDLKKSLRSAIRWCDSELTAMEAKLPPRYADEDE